MNPPARSISHEYWINIQYKPTIVSMDETPADLWIAACAHRLQRQWHTVDPETLEEVAAELWRDPRLSSMAPAEAAARWLEPVQASACPIAVNVQPDP